VAGVCKASITYRYMYSTVHYLNDVMYGYFPATLRIRERKNVYFTMLCDIWERCP